MVCYCFIKTFFMKNKRILIFFLNSLFQQEIGANKSFCALFLFCQHIHKIQTFLLQIKVWSADGSASVAMIPVKKKFYLVFF